MTIVPRDGARSRLFVAPAGQWITLDAGRIARAVYDPKQRTIASTLDPADRFTPAAHLRVEAPAPGGRAMMPIGGRAERGGHSVALGAGPTQVILR